MLGCGRSVGVGRGGYWMMKRIRHWFPGKAIEARAQVLVVVRVRVFWIEAEENLTEWGELLQDNRMLLCRSTFWTTFGTWLAWRLTVRSCNLCPQR